MFMFDWSAIMTPRRPPWTAGVHFRDFVSYGRLAPEVQHSLSAVTLGIYLCAHTTFHSLYLFYCGIVCCGLLPLYELCAKKVDIKNKTLTWRTFCMLCMRVWSSKVNFLLLHSSFQGGLLYRVFSPIFLFVIFMIVRRGLTA